jgi:hypothetical protein
MTTRQAALLCGFFLLCWGRAEAAPAYTIQRIKAFLYHDQTGELSEEDILAPPVRELFNVIIGTNPSHATMVVVELSGEAGSYESGRKVSLTVTGKKGRVVLKKSTSLGVFGKDGKYFVAFWLYETGCEPLSLSAKLTGQPSASKADATINFICGE